MKKIIIIFIREERCQRIFENIFSEKFPKVRPSWLLNKETGYHLELDGYCKKLKLAFEYDGIQHQKYPNPFHRDLSDFNRQRKRDKIKNRRCKSHKVILIRIKYNILDLEEYMRKLKKKGLCLSERGFPSHT